MVFLKDSSNLITEQEGTAVGIMSWMLNNLKRHAREAYKKMNLLIH